MKTPMQQAVVKKFSEEYLIPIILMREFQDDVDNWSHNRRNGLFDKKWGTYKLRN
jgi:hypothetical protein